MLFEKSSRTGFPKLFCIQRLIQSFLICFIFAVCYVKMNIVLPVFIVRNRNFSVFGQKKKTVTRTAKMRENISSSRKFLLKHVNGFEVQSQNIRFLSGTRTMELRHNAPHFLPTAMIISSLQAKIKIELFSFKCYVRQTNIYHI